MTRSGKAAMTAAPAAGEEPALRTAFKKAVKTHVKLSTRGRGPEVRKSLEADVTKAIFRLHACVYQKGPNQGELTGNMLAELLPAGPNDECKAALLPLLLDSILKWYPTDKIFKARVHTKAQAAMLLAKMRELYPASTDLPLTLEAAGEWNPACVKEVAVVPTECVVAKSGIEVGQVILNDGNLYPLREPIKALGFTFVKDFNNVPGQDFWVAPADKVDLAALAALYEKWGWDATLYDGAE